jgi:hypothetical protein
MRAYFGLVGIGRELSIQGLMSRFGLGRRLAEEKQYRYELAEFLRREEPPFSAAFPEAPLWG